MSRSVREAVRTWVDALVSRRRFGLFASAGLSGATVDAIALWALVEFARLEPLVGKVIAWELGVIVVFAVNEYWTFSQWGPEGRGPLGRRFVRSNLVRSAGFLVTLGVLAALVYGAGIWYFVANLAGMAVGFVVNYSLETLYTWRVHRGGR